MAGSKQQPTETPTTEVGLQDTQTLEGLAKQLSELKDIVDRQADNDRVQQKAFDQLYEELKQYKEDFIFQSEKPLLLDLVLFYDSVSWFQKSLIKKEMSPDVIADSFQYLIDEFVELLYRRDVLPMDAQDTFNLKQHKVVKTVPAESEEEDYQIHQVLKRGFTRNGRILRAEEVVVKRAVRTSDGGAKVAGE